MTKPDLITDEEAPLEKNTTHGDFARIVQESLNNLNATQNQLDIGLRSIADRQVDIINQVPGDLIPIIMKGHKTRQLLISLSVSKAWCVQLSSWPELWRVIRLYGNADTFGKEALLNIRYIQPHIVQLYLSFPSSDLWDIMLEQILNGSFVKLHKIKVNGSDIRPAKLLPALSRISGTLKEVDIILRGTDPLLIRMDELTTACPLLEKLYYNYDRWTSNLTSPLHEIPDQLHASCLTDLRITHAVIKVHELENMLSQCPKLRCLMIYASNMEELDPATWRHHQNLQTLVLNYELKDEPVDYGDTKTGLRYLAMKVEKTRHIKHLLNYHHQTLESIYIHFPDQAKLQLSCGDFTNIRLLSITGECLHLYSGQLIQRLSTLEVLHLDRFDAEIASEIAKFKTLVHLKDLRLAADFGSGPSYYLSSEIRSMFKWLASSTQLRRIGLLQCTFVDDSTLPILLKMEYLESITFGWSSKITQPALFAFFDQLQQRRSSCIVNDVSLVGLRYVDDAVLERVFMLPNLKKVSLDLLKNISRPVLENLRGARKDVSVTYTRCFQ